MNKILLLIFNFFFFFLIFTYPVLADTVQCSTTVVGTCAGDQNCIDAGNGQCACSFSITCNRPNPVCCTTPGGCDPATGVHAKQWDYFRNFTCGNVSYDPVFQQGQATCTYNYDQCAAVDNCTSGPYLNAGLCSDSGCAVGGVYKTCCAGSTLSTNSCVATTPSVIPNGGVCPSGTNSIQCGGAGQPACGQAACATPTPAPTPPPGCSGAPTGPGPGTVPGICDPAATSCTVPCTKTCTDNSGQTCAVTGQSVWACQGGTQWFNNGTCYASCPVSCNAPQCQGNQTRTTCGGACTLPR